MNNKRIKILNVAKALLKRKSLVVKIILIVLIILSLLIFVFRLGGLKKIKKTLFIFKDPKIVDTNIKPATGQYNFENTTNNFNTYFKSSPIETGAIKFSNTKAEITFSTSPTQSFGNISFDKIPKVDKNIITYENIFPNIDLKYSVSETRLLEEFVVKDKNTALNTNKIIQNAQTNNIDEYKEDNGKIVFYKKGKEVFIIPEPVIYEQNDPKISSYGIKYEIKKSTNDTYTISKVITDEGKKWLSDPARKYPIVIDLVIDNADTAGNWVSSGTFTTVSQETTLKQEGTGSVKVQTTGGSLGTMDLMEYSSDANAQTAYVSNLTGSTVTDTYNYTGGSQTFTVPAGTSTITVTAKGAGGNTGGNASAGGAGGYSYGAINVTSGESIPVIVGGAGSDGGCAGGGPGGYGGGGSGGSGNCNVNDKGGGGGGGSSKVTASNGTIIAGGGGGGASGTAYTGGAGGGSSGANGSPYGVAQCWGGGYGLGGGGGSGGSGGNLGLGCNAGNGTAGTSTNGGTGGSGNDGSRGRGGGGGGGGYGGGGGGGATLGWGSGTGGGGGSLTTAGGTLTTGGGAAVGANGTVTISYFKIALQSYTESTIKSQGSYALKGLAAITTSLNKTLTRSVSPTINLTNINTLTFDIRSTRTGSNIKIGIHDSGGTTTEITPNITSANVFQTVAWDVSGVSNANKDAIDQIIVTIVNADAENTFYIDNFTYITNSLYDTVTLTKGSTNISTNSNLSFWIRSTLAGQTLRFQFGETNSSEQTYDITVNSANTWEKKSWDISAITAASRDAVTKFAFKITDSPSAQTFYFDYIVAGDPPNTPSISANFLHDKVKTPDTTPEIRFSTTDPESEEITYQISWDTDSSFPAPTAKTSDTDPGFANVTTPADTDPFNSGDTVSYTFQSALTNGTTYFYRVRAKDPTGSNTYSSWSSIRSFTIDTTLNKGNHWFETRHDQFSSDTINGTIIDDANNNVYTPPANTTIDMMEYASDTAAQSAYVTNGLFYATGGTVATASGYTTHTFTSGGTFAVSGSKNAEVLVVAGGGGAGWYYGGGGGGGGLCYQAARSLSSGSNSVTVGGGGTSASYQHGGNGGNSTFDTITSIGGGGGADGDTFDCGMTFGWAGGSGGGGTAWSDWSCGGGGGSTQGNSGGATCYGEAGAGAWVYGYGRGGGAGVNGNGSGRAYSISGASVTYANGGNGSGYSATYGSGGSTRNVGVGGITILKYLSIQPLQAYSESSTKSQGSYALKGVAAITTGLNKTLTRTVSPTVNLSYFNTLKFDIRSTRTGSNIKIGIHDSGGTTTETTPNVVSADTYQTVSWDVSGVTNANKDAIDQIIITIVNADAENTFYIDNFYGESPTGGVGYITSTAINQANINIGRTNWGTATVGKTETNGSIKVQAYYDNGGTPTIIPDVDLTGNSTGFSGTTIDLSGVSTTTYPILYLKGNLVYTGGSPTLNDWGIIFDEKPHTPTLDSPADSAVSQPVRTVFKTTATDGDSDYLKYKIQLCTDVGMTTGCQTFDQTSSGTGWSGMNANGNTAYASGTQATYTIQTANLLTPNSTYYWRTYAIDPGGINSWSDTQGAPYSFTTSIVPNLPTLDLPVNTAIDQAVFPVLKTTGTDPDSDYLQYKIQLCKNVGMTTSCSTFDQTSSATGWSGMNADGNTAYSSGTQAVYTVQSQLDFDTTYYWRSYAKDVDGSETWSVTQTTPYSFTTGNLPTTPSALLTESLGNPTAITDTTPEFSAICNHSVDGATFNKYQIIVSTKSDFSTTAWDSGSSGTAMSTCTRGQRSTDISYGGTALAVDGTMYHWKIRFWDEWEVISPWSSEEAVFTMDNSIGDKAATNCRIQETIDDSSLTLKWNDNSTNETQFRIEKNANNAGFNFLVNSAANSTSYQDNLITPGNTYQYRVRAEGSVNTEWCTTVTVDLSPGTLFMEGVTIE